MLFPLIPQTWDRSAYLIHEFLWTAWSLKLLIFSYLQSNFPSCNNNNNVDDTTWQGLGIFREIFFIWNSMYVRSYAYIQQPTCILMKSFICVFINLLFTNVPIVGRDNCWIMFMSIFRLIRKLGFRFDGKFCSKLEFISNFRRALISIWTQ